MLDLLFQCLAFIRLMRPNVAFWIGWLKRHLHGRATPLIFVVLTPWCSTTPSDPAPSSPASTSTTTPVTTPTTTPTMTTSGDAFVSADAKAQTWTIGNSGIHVTFGFTPSQDFVLEQILDPQS